MKNIHTIDATGKILGRVASEAAKHLMGKNTVSYVSNAPSEIKVIIENAKQTKMSEKRLNETLHLRYSGHPGGLKSLNNKEIIDKKGWKDLYTDAVYGMLPSNKLRPIMMKNLTVNE